MSYDGPERRTDDTNVRLALVEQSCSQAEVRHIENKTSLIAVHRRITESTSLTTKGIDAILEKLDKKNEDCAEHKGRTVKLESNILWVERWVATSWAALIAGLTLLFTHHDKVKGMKP